MGAFRKKPVVVEAHQWDGTEESANFIVSWIIGLGGDAQYVNVDGLTSSLGIATLEGEMMATASDWIIQGVKGEFYPVKDAIFRETYEEVGIASR